MISDKETKEIAIARIDAAMRTLRSESFIKPPTKTIGCDSYGDLDRSQIDQGVIAFILATRLSGGSIADMNLYKLIRTYLWNMQARSEINAIVARCGL